MPVFTSFSSTRACRFLGAVWQQAKRHGRRAISHDNVRFRARAPFNRKQDGPPFARARALIVKLAYLGTLALKLPNRLAAWLSRRTRQRVGVLSEAQVTKESSCEPPPIWFQWTVVFVILGLGAWVAYPAVNPFESSGSISTFIRHSNCDESAHSTDRPNPELASGRQPSALEAVIEGRVRFGFRHESSSSQPGLQSVADRSKSRVELGHCVRDESGADGQAILELTCPADRLNDNARTSVAGRLARR
jgi:hypothetical protein